MCVAATADRKLDLEAKDLACVDRADFWEDRVILETDSVVSTTIELGWDAAEVTNAWEDVADETIDERFHALATERHHSADHATFACLEVRNRFARDSEDRFLSRDLLKTFTDVLVQFFAIHLRLVDTDVQDNFLKAWECMHVRHTKLFLELSGDLAAEPVMKGCVSHGEF